MTQAEPRTIEEIVLPLAERMVLHCSLCRGGEEHPVCNGTGEVPEFPTLRRPCPHVVAEQDWSGTQLTQLGIALSLNDDHQRECRGWLPVTTTDALLEAGKRYGFWLNWSEALKHWVVAEANLLLGLKVVGTGETPNLALALALEAARKQEVEK